MYVVCGLRTDLYVRTRKPDLREIITSNLYLSTFSPFHPTRQK